MKSSAAWKRRTEDSKWWLLVKCKYIWIGITEALWRKTGVGGGEGRWEADKKNLWIR